jgi:hypothetical protein
MIIQHTPSLRCQALRYFSREILPGLPSIQKCRKSLQPRPALLQRQKKLHQKWNSLAEIQIDNKNGVLAINRPLSRLQRLSQFLGIQRRNAGRLGLSKIQATDLRKLFIVV